MKKTTKKMQEDPSKKSVYEKLMLLPVKNQHVIAITVMIMLICITFFPVIFGESSLYPITYIGRSTEYLLPNESVERYLANGGIYMDAGASDWVEVPFMKAANENILNGELPLWSPYNSLGMPIIQNTNGSTLAPLGLFLNLVSTEFAWNIMYLFRLFFIMLFTYFFMHKKTSNLLLSLTGAVVFGYSGYVMLYFNIFFLHVDAFLPMLMFATECFIEKRNKRSWALVLLAVAGMMLGGNPQNLITCVAFTIPYYIFYVYKDTTSWKQIFCKKPISYIAAYASAYISAGLVTLFYWLPFIELYLLGYNSHSTMTGIHKLGLNQLLGLIFPARILKFYEFLLPWAGLTVVLVVLFQLRFKKTNNKKEKIFIVGFVLLFMLKIVGFFLVQWVGYLPIFNFLSFTKYNSSMYFAIMMLFTYALKDMLELSRKKRNLMMLGCILIGNIAIASIYYYKNKLNISGIPYIVAFFIIAMVVRALIYTDKKYILVGSIASIAMLELMIFPAHVSGLYIDKETAFTTPDFANYIIENQENEHTRIFAVGGTMIGNISSYYGIQSIAGISATPEAKYFSFMNNLVLNHNLDIQWVTTQSNTFYPESKRILDLLGVEYLIADNYQKIDAPNINPVYETDRLTIYKNHAMMPRAFVVGDAVFAQEEEQVLKIMKSDTIDLRTAVVLPEDKSYALSLSFAGGQAEITDYNANSIRITCKMDDNGFLVLSDLYYPGWKVYVNGKRQEILQADYILRSVYLEEGEYEVEFIYHPTSVFYGFYMSLGIGALLLCGFFVHYLFTRRRAQT